MSMGRTSEDSSKSLMRCWNKDWFKKICIEIVEGSNPSTVLEEVYINQGRLLFLSIPYSIQYEGSFLPWKGFS